jgi:hypothetical protein
VKKENWQRPASPPRDPALPVTWEGAPEKDFLDVFQEFEARAKNIKFEDLKEPDEEERMKFENEDENYDSDDFDEEDEEEEAAAASGVDDGYYSDDFDEEDEEEDNNSNERREK